ncbi:acetyl-CoA synthetase-like protein [Penicillium taxi]|uniref:acetyl-CoA synthetase-like protein n=1 Tax=Penicillium taxi TaxID=168475 RepID=UPI002545A47D|nr:acetyl-CoA synthetase-like protein [Penicillium taxi]KAJ5887873.1 acetyl-CoA synthetase-like protein [Penicillium taxi]
MSPISEAKGIPLSKNIPSLDELFCNAIKSYPENLAVISTQQPAELYNIRSQPLDDDEYLHQPYLRWNYRDLDQGINRLVNALAARGIGKESPMFIFLPNTVEYVMATWAAYRLGCVHVPINPRNLSNQTEVKHMMETVLESFPSQQTVIIAASCDSAQRIDDLALEPCLRIILGGQADNWISFEDLMKDVGCLCVTSSQKFWDPTDATVLFTSGSTGFPKGCLTRGSRVVAALQCRNKNRTMVPGDKVAIVVPNNHGFGFNSLIPPLTRGAAVVFPGPSFVPQDVMGCLQREQCTHMSMVPTMVHALVTLGNVKKGRGISSLRQITLAGALVTPDLARMCFDQLGSSTVEILYGMTEGTEVSTGPVKEFHSITKGGHISIGVPAQGSKVRICAPGSIIPLARGVPGELNFSGPALVTHYMGNGSGRFYDDGNDYPWFATGDKAVMDHDGQLYIMGRYKETIIRGGENIEPGAIETSLSQVPELSILEPQIVGVSDPIAGEVPVAVVNKAVDRGVAKFLQDTIRTNMGMMYVPAEIIPLQSLGLEDYPRTMSGKIQREKLRVTVQKYRDEKNLNRVKDSSDRFIYEEKLKQVWGQFLGLDAKFITANTELSAFADSETLTLIREKIWRDVTTNVSLSKWLAADTIMEQLQLIEKANQEQVLHPGSYENQPMSKFPEKTAELLISSIAAERDIDIDETTRLVDLGVDSIMAITILDRVMRETGQMLPPSLFFDHQTVAQFRKSLCPSSSPASHGLCFSKLLHGEPNPRTPSLFLFPPASGYAFSYSGLPEFPDNLAVYTLGSPFLTTENLNWTVEDAAAAYIETIRAIQPCGPYLLGGWSMGGALSYETAVQLSKAGEQIKGLILIDSPFPSPIQNLPDLTIELLDMLNWFPPIRRPGKPDIEFPFHRKKHTIESFRALSKYKPRAINASSWSTDVPVKIFMIWAKIGTTEKLVSKIDEQAEIVKKYGSKTEKRACNKWQTEPRQSLGPSGWDQVVGVENVECHSLEADHETILEDPQVSFHQRDCLTLDPSNDL